MSIITYLASAVIRSQRMGFRLYAMAEEPICPFSKGSSISLKLCKIRISLANLLADWATPPNAASTCASTFRE